MRIKLIYYSSRNADECLSNGESFNVVNEKIIAINKNSNFKYKKKIPRAIFRNFQRLIHSAEAPGEFLRKGFANYRWCQ